MLVVERFPVTTTLFDARVKMPAPEAFVRWVTVVTWLSVSVAVAEQFTVPAQLGVPEFLSVSVQLPATLKVAELQVIVAEDVVIVPVL